MYERYIYRRILIICRYSGALRIAQVGTSFLLFTKLPVDRDDNVGSYIDYVDVVLCTSCFRLRRSRISSHVFSLEQELGSSNRPHCSGGYSSPEAAVSIGGGHVLRHQGQCSCSGNGVRGDRPISTADRDTVTSSVAGDDRAFSGDPFPSETPACP